MSDESDDATEQPQPAQQPSARLLMLQQQAVDIGKALAQCNVGANWGDKSNSQELRLYAIGRAAFAAMVAKGLLTQDEADCFILEGIITDMERILQSAEEQALRAKQPQIALPGPPQLPPGALPGILPMRAIQNGHRH